MKLAMRFPEELVRNEVVRLREEGLQSDSRFVESYVYSKRNKGDGPIRMDQDKVCIEAKRGFFLIDQ